MSGTLPPDPSFYGEPVVLESWASELRRAAERLSSRGEALARLPGRMEFEGPAAERFKRDMDRARSRAAKAAGDAVEVANYLSRAAARVQGQIDAWYRAQETETG